MSRRAEINTRRRRLRRLALGLAIVALGAGSTANRSRGTEADDGSAGGIGAILPIRDQITDITVQSLSRRIDEALEKGATVLIFDLDTPGGLVTSSIAVADQIKSLTDVTTVAWVNPNAHSGGTIVAVACHEIVMSRSSRMGDSQVIIGGPGGVQAVPEELQPKAYTPVLTEFRTSCRLRGYDQSLCEAFVIPDREVWWIENTATGEKRFVLRDQKTRLIDQDDRAGDAAGPADDDASGPVRAASAKQADPPDDLEEKPEVADDRAASAEPKAEKQPAGHTWRLVETYFDPLMEMEVDAIQPIVPADQLLEMSPAEAMAFGFSKGIISSERELTERYDLTEIIHLDPTWSESLAYWLTSMYVRGFLMVIILLAAYVEFHTPGVGVPGLVALICLGIFVGAPYLSGLANVWEILAILVGFGLIALEVFVIPGFGIAGISGIFLVVAALVATFVPDEPGQPLPIYLPSLPGTVYYLKAGLVTVVASIVMSLVGMVMLSRYLPRTPVFARIVPPNPMPSEVVSEDPYRGLVRVGDVGTTIGPLRPAGKARFGSEVVDVVTQGEYLEASMSVQVIEYRGNRVVVRAV